MLDNLTIHAAPLPFQMHRQCITIPHGLCLSEIIHHICPKLGSAYDVVITINGESIDSALWPMIHPEKDAIIGLNVIPAGGGKKNPLASIISIALLVAAPYMAASITASAITSTGITSLGFSQAVYGIARVGIGLVGFLATSMLSSTPRQNRAADEAPESPTQFIEGASNSISKYSVVPICLGTNRMVPPQAALPYTETVANQQFVRQLFTFGYGDQLVISDEKIGETALSSFVGVNREALLSGNLHSGTTIFSNDVFQDQYSITLSNVAGYITRTTQTDTDEASLDITFQAGLVSFAEDGTKNNQSVQFEIQYRETGSGDPWSTSIAGTSYPGAVLTPAPIAYVGQNVVFNGTTYVRREVRKDYVLLNLLNGALSIVSGSGALGAQFINIPENHIVIASYDFTRDIVISTGVSSSYISNFSDNRAAYIGVYLPSGASFAPSVVGSNISVTSGTIIFQGLKVTAAQSEAVRVAFQIKFPARGQYDVRVRRVTADSDSTRTIDVATWTAMRSITYQEPVNLEGINGVAIRIQASDQLNGVISQYNALVSNVILDYVAATGAWVEGLTSNPASIYRYVLQSQAFAKRLPDSRINLAALEAWHIYCDSKGYTYNRVIDYDTSVEDVLRDVAAAGMATPHHIDGTYSVVVDNERPDIAGIVTPRNSWGYNGTIAYPDMPDAFRVEFRNKDNGYQVDERIVYNDGFTAANAQLYERLEFLSCTDSDLAWKYARRYLASGLLQIETHTFSMDFENCTFNRGDRIQFVSDVILVGVGSGRIKELITDTSGTIVTGFIIDDTVTIPTTNVFGARIRHADGIGGFTYHQLVTVVGETNEFILTTPVDIADFAGIGSLVAFVEDGMELDLIVKQIQPQKDMSAAVIAINYAPERFNADTGTIPPFESNITIPLEFIAPLAPLLASPIQSDESVMIRNSDGSFTGRMIISLTNRNEAEVIPVVQVRQSGSNVWNRADILTASPDQVVLTGFDDGKYYDISIRYQRPNGLILSTPLLLNNTRYVGATTLPDQVSGFTITIAGETAILKWLPNDDIDVTHYHVKYSRAVEDVTWGTAQTLDANVIGTQLTIPYQFGTYLIKAVDLLGNESAMATAIIARDEGALRNVVEILEEDPDFDGFKDNVSKITDGIILSDTSQDGYYYFEDTLDLLDVYTSFLSANILAGGYFFNNIFDMDDIFVIPDMFGAGNNDLFAIDDIFAMDDIFGIGTDSWIVQLQMRFTNDDPNLTATVWSDWEEFVAGYRTFRAVEFRLLMRSLDANITPLVRELSVTIDMPDRIELGEDITVPVTGATITYPAPFINNPAVNITTQDGATDDRIDYSYKERDGFTFRVWNATVGGYVERTFDYTSAGYGRVVS